MFSSRHGFSPTLLGMIPYVSYLLELVRRRMQVGGAVDDGHRLRISEVVRAVYKRQGFRGFYVGLSIGYIKVVPMVATSFLVYERVRSIW